MIIAETQRLLLRHLHLFDGDAMDRVFGDAEVMRYGDGVQTQAWIRDWLGQTLEHYNRLWGFGPWAVVEKASSDTIGYCGLFRLSDINGSPEIEIGYRLARAWWGKGYATEAAVAVRDYGFHTLSLRRLVASIDPSNLASIRVATKLGMRYEQEYLVEGWTHPDHIYVVLSGDIEGKTS